MDDEIYDRIIFLADPDLNEPVMVIGLDGWIDAGIIDIQATYIVG